MVILKFQVSIHNTLHAHEFGFISFSLLTFFKIGLKTVSFLAKVINQYIHFIVPKCTKMHQNEYRFSKIFSGVTPPNPPHGRGRPPPGPTPRTTYGAARLRSFDCWDPNLAPSALVRKYRRGGKKLGGFAPPPQPRDLDPLLGYPMPQGIEGPPPPELAVSGSNAVRGGRLQPNLRTQNV